MLFEKRDESERNLANLMEFRPHYQTAVEEYCKIH